MITLEKSYSVTNEKIKPNECIIDIIMIHSFGLIFLVLKEYR